MRWNMQRRSGGRGGGEGVVCFVQDYLKNTVGTVQINIAGGRERRRQNCCKHIQKIS